MRNGLFRPFTLKRRKKGDSRRHHGDGKDVQYARLSILQHLWPLIQLADERGMNLYLACQALTFTPAQLRATIADGHYIMGVEWWQLRRP